MCRIFGWACVVLSLLSLYNNDQQSVQFWIIFAQLFWIRADIEEMKDKL